MGFTQKGVKFWDNMEGCRMEEKRALDGTQDTGLKGEEETAVELESELPSPTCGLSSSESRGWDLPGVVKEP